MRAGAAIRREFAPAGSFAAETQRLESHIPRPSALSRSFLAGLVRRDGFATVRLKGEIGVGTGSKLCADLDAAREAGAKSVLVHIRSNGGDAREALAVCRALRRWNSRTGGSAVAFIAGEALSAAGLIAISADYVVAAEDARFLVHCVSGGTERERVLLNESQVRILSERTLATHPEEVRKWMAHDYGRGAEFSADGAVDYGLADEVGGIGRAHEIARIAARPGALLAHARTERQRTLAARRISSLPGGAS